MNKKYWIGVLVLLILVLAVGGYYFWKPKTQKSTSNIVNPAVENVQNANPYNKTNPFSNMRVNPFE